MGFSLSLPLAPTPKIGYTLVAKNNLKQIKMLPNTKSVTILSQGWKVMQKTGNGPKNINCSRKSESRKVPSSLLYINTLTILSFCS